MPFHDKENYCGDNWKDAKEWIQWIQAMSDNRLGYFNVYFWLFYAKNDTLIWSRDGFVLVGLKS